MNLSKTLILFLIVTIASSLMSCEEKEKERKVTEKEVPKAVLQVFNQTYPRATVKEYAEEIEDGQKFYEISFEFEGRRIDAIYKPDGKLNAIEEIIATEQLPDVIHQAISKEFPQFSIQLAEKIEKEGKIFFEVVVLNTEINKSYEILLSDEGIVIEKEMKIKNKD